MFRLINVSKGQQKQVVIDCQVENLYFILQKDFQVFNTQVVVVVEVLQKAEEVRLEVHSDMVHVVEAVL